MRSIWILPFLVGVSLTAAAEVRLTPEQRIAPEAPTQRNIQVLQRSGHVLAAWRPDWPAVDVSFDGVVLPGAHVDAANGAYTLAAGSSTFLLVWDDLSHVYARRIGAGGEVLDVVPRDLCRLGYLSSLGVVFDGSSYVVACTDDEATRIVRITESGSITDDVGPRIVLEAVRPLLANGRLVFAGARVICCHSSPTVYPYSTVLVYDVNDSLPPQPNWIPVDGLTWFPAAGPDRVIVAIPDSRIRLAQASFDRTMFRAPYVLPQLANVRPAGVALVWDGSEYVLAWIETIDGGSVIRGLRLNRNGDPIDDAPFEISGPALYSALSATVTERGVVIAYSRKEGFEVDVHAYMRTLERLGSTGRRQSVRH